MIITATAPAGFEIARAAHKDLRAMRHVIRTVPSAAPPQRHALTPRVARPTGLMALEKLLRPLRAAEMEAEQVRKPRPVDDSCLITTGHIGASVTPVAVGTELGDSHRMLPPFQYPCPVVRQASIMDEAAAAAGAAAAGSIPSANGVLSASADNGSTLATLGTADMTAPWQEKAGSRRWRPNVRHKHRYPESRSNFGRGRRAGGDTDGGRYAGRASQDQDQPFATPCQRARRGPP